ncbi:PocR ligand-binding domain-containing protein [Eubacteriaceae bacterium ES3]|nr:PocR ligand-binding domain-containing protein [Eubacteriaceae bacterium ES3]
MKNKNDLGYSKINNKKNKLPTETHQLLDERQNLLDNIQIDQPIVDNIDFNELFDLADIQKLQQEFAEATGVASVITHVDGTPITVPSNFTRLCRGIIRKTEKGRKNCYKSDAVIGAYSADGPNVKRCLSGGLWDAGAAITVGDKHVANWLIGQVRDESVHSEHLAAYAREIGADEDEMVAAFNEVPQMSEEQFNRIARFLYTIANQLSNLAYKNYLQKQMIKENVEKQEEILYLSYHDFLTGMYNRRYYEESLSRLNRPENLPLALLLGDVNGLKYLNDTVGHIAGDELLKKIADIIDRHCLKDDVAARLGGDEFVVIMPRTSQKDAEDRIEAMSQSAQSESVAGMPLSISFGCEMITEEEQSIYEVFKKAEDKMYREKNRIKIKQLAEV